MPENAVSWLVQHSVVYYDGGAGNGGGSDGFHVYVDGASEADGGPQELVLEEATPPGDSYEPRVSPDQVFVPGTTISAGTKLTIEAYDACSGITTTSALEITPAAPRPSTLGTLRTEVMRGELHPWTDSSSCVTPVDAAYTYVQVAMDEEAAPFADVFRYVLLVDGQPYHREPRAMGSEDSRMSATLAGGAFGVGVERVFAVCSADGELDEQWLKEHFGIAEGTHELKMAGLLPDGSAVLSEAVTVELNCEGGCAADAGTCLEDDAGADDDADDDADTWLEDDADTGTWLDDDDDDDDPDTWLEDDADDDASAGPGRDTTPAEATDSEPETEQLVDSGTSGSEGTARGVRGSKSSGCALAATPGGSGAPASAAWLLVLAALGLARRSRPGND